MKPSVQRWWRPDRPAYRGLYTQQFETDLDRYEQLIRELRPPFIVEIGRAEGGTALFLADILGEVRPDGLLISIDIDPPRVQPPTVTAVRNITASSTHATTVALVRNAAAGERGLVLLDGDHSTAHVARELDLYADMADYLVVEDTIMRDLGHQDGPHAALDAWLPDHPEFTADPDPVLTQHPGGWLRRTQWQP